jgi:hypothetical protein
MVLGQFQYSKPEGKDPASFYARNRKGRAWRVSILGTERGINGLASFYTRNRGRKTRRVSILGTGRGINGLASFYTQSRERKTRRVSILGTGNGSGKRVLYLEERGLNEWGANLVLDKQIENLGQRGGRKAF